MFFFFFDNKAQRIIVNCLNVYFLNKTHNSFFCDVSDLFSNLDKKDLQKRIKSIDKQAYELLLKKYPDNEEDLSQISLLFDDYYQVSYSEFDVAFSILYWTFKLFRKKKPFEKNKDEIMSEFVRFLNNNYDDSFGYVDSVIYKENEIIKYIITNVTDFLNVLHSVGANNDCFFRGHSKISYKLVPSIMRSDALLANERNMYQELIVNCPNEFNSFKRRIDFLVKMQHYGLPTRLIDITRNPLVALYFACCKNPNNTGEVIVFRTNKNEIKSYYSDTVAMLSTLPLLSYNEQIDLMDYLYLPKNKKEPESLTKFLYFLKEEKPAFNNKIKNTDMDNCFIVYPKRENERIIKQDGAFFICGINASIDNKIAEKRLFVKDKMPIICIENKNAILNELDLLSINKSTLFPEIDYVAEYIKSKYSV